MRGTLLSEKRWHACVRQNGQVSNEEDRWEELLTTTLGGFDPFEPRARQQNTNPLTTEHRGSCTVVQHPYICYFYKEEPDMELM